MWIILQYSINNIQHKNTWYNNIILFSGNWLSPNGNTMDNVSWLQNIIGFIDIVYSWRHLKWVMWGAVKQIEVFKVLDFNLPKIFKQ